MPCSPSADSQPSIWSVGHDVLGHVVVDLVVGDEALLLAELDQLVAHRVGLGAALAAALLGDHAGLGLEGRRIGLRGRAALGRAGRQVVVAIVVERRAGTVVVAEVDVHRLAGLGGRLATGAGLCLGLGGREVVVVLVAEAVVLVGGRAGRLHRLGLVGRLLRRRERREHLGRVVLGRLGHARARGSGGLLAVRLLARRGLDLRTVRLGLGGGGLHRSSSGLLRSNLLRHDFCPSSLRPRAGPALAGARGRFHGLPTTNSCGGRDARDPSADSRGPRS